MTALYPVGSAHKRKHSAGHAKRLRGWPHSRPTKQTLTPGHDPKKPSLALTFPSCRSYVGPDGRRREKYVVVDARPELNARANQAAGMGFENTPQYKLITQVRS
jgi:hypothetical protein